MLLIALRDSQGTSPLGLGVLGVLLVVFGLANLGIGTWARRHVEAGQPLPRMLRRWQLLVDHPKLLLLGVCAQVTAGAVFLVVAIVQAAG